MIQQQPNARQLPSNVTVRQYRGPEDLPGMATTFNESEHADGLNMVIGPEDIAQNYRHLVNSDPYEDLVLAEVGTEIVAYGRVQWNDYLDGNRVYSFFIQNRPEWRGCGIEEELLKFAIVRSREQSRANPTENSELIRIFTSDRYSELQQALSDQGFAAVRYGFQMVRDLSEPIGTTDLPDGVEVRPITPDQHQAVWDADVAAFRDHWGFREPTESDYENWKSNKFFQPEIWQVAWAGDQIVGQVLNFINHEENAQYGTKLGYTESISVQRAWRKRGIASALINRSLAMLKELGYEEAALGVDAQNPTGALRVYEGCGFRVKEKSITYDRALWKDEA